VMTDSRGGVDGRATAGASLMRLLRRARCGTAARIQHPKVVYDSEWSASAGLLGLTRIMIIDERRSARSCNEVAILNTAGVARCAASDRVDTALSRL